MIKTKQHQIKISLQKMTMKIESKAILVNMQSNDFVHNGHRLFMPS